MATVPDYVDLEVMKAWLDIDATDTSDDAVLNRRITAASRLVDQICRYEPGHFAGITATRTFDASSRTHLWIPSLVSLTTLKTDEDGDGVYETTWATTDYRLYPLNTTPKTEIRMNADQGANYFPVGAQRVQIVGVWGESADPPTVIQEAAMILANRLKNRAKTPEGVMGSSEFGFVTMADMDPDVKLMLMQSGYVNAGAVFA